MLKSMKSMVDRLSPTLPMVAIGAVTLLLVVVGVGARHSAPRAQQAAAASPASAPAEGGNAPEGTYREIDWQALLPKGWDPLAPFRGMRLQRMQDGDPRAQEALFKAREYWKTAPTEPGMDGARVRIPGYVVSLDAEGDQLREFLLVPYFGACIHVPPPPSNQIIHVLASRPLPGLRTMDPVWVSGVLRVERAETMMGDAGYAMHDARLERYQER